MSETDCRNSLQNCFSALQRAENSSIAPDVARAGCGRVQFQCSSASRKFLNFTIIEITGEELGVSVLFSEPKIPQCRIFQIFVPEQRRGFSALQRAENSSIYRPSISSSATVRFQCSSASRKFLNLTQKGHNNDYIRSFSALQRAENSSI